MIFNSLTFLVFLIIVVLGYWFLNRQLRIWLIFLSSILFYGFWRWEFLPLIFFSTIIDYLVSLELDKVPNSNQRKRKRLLFLSLALNLGLLFYFKYLIFFTDNLYSLAHLIGFSFDKPILQIILPLGISFYTFQTISYTVDVYRRHTKPIKNFALYGSYVTFFPQLVAGPILRVEEVANQLSERPTFQLLFLSEGLKRILYGLFLKVVLADNIAPLIDAGFSMSSGVLSAIDVWTLAFLFGFQIYFDFAGYSHIAIGCAKLMGINFPENFNFPYASRSFKSFWKRWHISLSSWIRDYLYLPLAGASVISAQQKSKGGIDINEYNKVTSQSKKDRALFLTWAIMGLWHGANWTFVFWGVYHAVMIYLERFFSNVRQQFQFFSKPFVGWAITIPLAMLGWIPFRANSMQDTLVMFQKVFNPFQYGYYSLRENTFLVTFILFLFITIAYLLSEYDKRTDLNSNRILRYGFETIKYTIIFILVFIFFRPVNQFIYFQF